MLWQDAWNHFTETGKINDYLNYTNMKSSQYGTDGLQRIDFHANNYNGNCNQGKDSW